MSGGVDSSVSAMLLKDLGYDVTGVFIKVWHPEWLPCDWKAERRDAMRAAAHARIPLVTLDLEKEYKKDVVDLMIKEYSAGRTPNPDVLCNKEIKFGAFYNFAKKNGADFVATGHYAEIRKLGNGNYELREGRDAKKDQSYFIWNIKKEQLPHVLFPIGGMAKPKVRKLAQSYGLPNAEKKDSQGLCFLGKIDMKDFLKHFIKEKKGSVLDTKGKKIGTHDGATFFTIGQRHGFQLSNGVTDSKPYYVVNKDMKRNAIVVSNDPHTDANENSRMEWELKETNWISEPDQNVLYSIRFRYHQKPQLGYVLKVGSTWKIQLKSPCAGVSLGQSAVVYHKKALIGGGVVK